MSTKSDPVQETAEDQRREKEAAEGVELRDESDEIIDTLKRQLESLQGQLAEYKAADSAGGQAPPGRRPPTSRAAADWNAALAPRISARLQGPAAELTARLERVIDQVQDPELRAELERCRETAFFLFDTFRQISDNHRLLTDSLSDDIREVPLADLSRMLAYCRGDTATPLAVTSAPGSPRQLALRTQSLMTIARKLAGLAGAIRGSGAPAEGMHIELEYEPAESPATELPGGLRLRMVTTERWERLRDPQDVSSVAFRSGATAESVVDLLYVEKIVQLQGGTLKFHHRGEHVHGFSVWLPAASAVGSTGADPV